MSTDLDEIRSLIARYGAAIAARDAAAVIACYAPDLVSYDLSPPLETGPAGNHDPAGLQSWFDTWSGPIDTAGAEPVIHAAGDIAFNYGLVHMTGPKKDGPAVDLWFRSTIGFRRTGEGWRIVHVHQSVPFAMDGSDRALLDLKP
jgi:ketosteroid isomerase-like protein